MNSDNDVDILEKTVVEGDIQEVRTRSLVLYNDDYNTFEFVIESLIAVCKHDAIQAEQCTMMVHYNGKCAVKGGSYIKLNPMREALCDRGLSAVIE